MRRLISNGAPYEPVPDREELEDLDIDAELAAIANEPDVELATPDPTAPISPYGAPTWSNRR